MTQDELKALFEQSTPVSQDEDLASLWEQSAPVQAAQPSAGPPPTAEQPSMFDRYLSTMRSIPQTVSTAVQNVATIGQAPKIQAFEAAAMGPEDYEQALAREEAQRARVKSESPVLYGATQAAAPLALAPFTGGASLPFAGGRFAAQGIAIPAIEGAVLGATQAAEEGKEMASGATMGGLLGGALGPIGYGLGSLAQSAAGKLFGPDRAERIVKESITETGLQPEEAIDRLRAGGEDYLMADLVPDATYQIQATQSPARQRIRQALETRQRGDKVTGEGGQKDRFKNIMNNFTGRYDENFYTNLRNIRKEQSELSKKNFDDAFEDTVKPTDEFVALTKTPVGREAFNKARTSYLNDYNLSDFPWKQRSQQDVNKAFSILNKDPVDTYDEFIKGIDDLKFWHKYKVQLDELADYTPAGQKIYKKVDRTAKNRAASNIGNTIRSELKTQSGKYEKALDDHRQFTQMDEGMRLGKDIYRMKTDEIEDKMANLTVPQDSVKAGIIQAVKEQVQQMMNTGSVGRKVTRNDNFKAVLKQVIPDQKEYAKFLNQIQRLEDQAYTYARTTRTVPTAENIRAIERAEKDLGPLGELANLNLGSAIRSGLGMVGRPTLPREEIADILLQQGPQAAQTLQRVYGAPLPGEYFPQVPGLLGLGFGGLGSQSMLQQ